MFYVSGICVPEDCVRLMNPWRVGLVRPRNWRFQGQRQEVGGYWLWEEACGEEQGGLNEGIWGCLILWEGGE